jgi:hypothetical protein
MGAAAARVARGDGTAQSDALSVFRVAAPILQSVEPRRPSPDSSTAYVPLGNRISLQTVSLVHAEVASVAEG